MNEQLKSQPRSGHESDRIKNGVMTQGSLSSAIKKIIAVNLFSKLGWELGLYYASYDDFHPDILARMYT